jgi:hypothetical protein
MRVQLRELMGYFYVRRRVCLTFALFAVLAEYQPATGQDIARLPQSRASEAGNCKGHSKRCEAAQWHPERRGSFRTFNWTGFSRIRCRTLAEPRILYYFGMTLLP